MEADLAPARGRLIHACFLAARGSEDGRELACFRRAAELYRLVGDERGEGEALFWTGIVHQVVRDDDEAAVPLFEQSYELALRVGDRLTMSYALRHLGISAHAAGRLDLARERLEESVRLRREIGFLPGGREPGRAGPPGRRPGASAGRTGADRGGGRDRGGRRRPGPAAPDRGGPRAVLTDRPVSLRRRPSTPGRRGGRRPRPSGPAPRVCRWRPA